MTILEKLYQRNVVTFELSNDKTQIEVTECCDHYYSHTLSKSEAKQLIDELTQLLEMMSDNLT